MKKRILVSVFLVIAFSLICVLSIESYTATTTFCGTKCHIMEKPYASWQNDKHGKTGKKEIRCVECHYAPGEKMTIEAKFKGLGQLFTYLSSDEKEVRKATHIADLSCSTAKCHPAESYMEKKLPYGEKKKVHFTHKPHFDKTLPGQQMHCTTCHIKTSDAKHFEVPKELCYICHFRRADYNSGRSACNLCHQIPTTPLQQQKQDIQAGTDEKIITHQSLEKAGVSCQSCHYQMISVNTALNPRACDYCHSDPLVLKKEGDMKVMHTEHVAKQKARCTDCHQTILHREGDFIKEAAFNCNSCHPDHHSYQRAMLIGAAYGGVPETPSLMHAVKTNCQGCHEQKELHKGEEILRGSAKACVDCHTTDHKKMLTDWEQEVGGELAFAKENYDRAEALVEQFNDKFTQKELNEFSAYLKSSKKTLNIVEFGNGVHNKKYAIMLIDEALNGIYNVLDVVETMTQQDEKEGEKKD